MGARELLGQAPYAHVRRVGLPRALLYYRYGTLWRAFFEGLGREVVESRPTDRGILERGDALSGDECCLASKIYMGHVDELVGACDAVFVPSMRDVGHLHTFCTKFQALPDLVANTFHEQRLTVASCLIAHEKDAQFEDAFLGLAQEFGATRKQAKRVVKAALKAQERAEKEAAERQQATLDALKAQRKAGAAPLSILLVAHPYIAHDPYLGGAICGMLSGMGAAVVHACDFDRRRSYKASEGFSQTMPWLVNRELVGAIELTSGQVDGIVLVSAFPCGPDSMTVDAIVRCLKETPILTLTVDAQSGTAGLQTRIESFVDILRYQRQGGYIHG